MNEIKDAITILKARWPEVLLILTLNLLFSLGHWPLQQEAKVYPPLMPAVFVLILAFIVIDVMLQIGFQRSIYLESRKRQSPLTLLQLGKHFFWRAVRLGLLLLVVHILLAWLIFQVAKQPLSISSGFWKTAQSDPLAYFGCYAISGLILIKPTLLVLPIVIVTDCRISESFKLLKQFRLSEAEGLVLVFIILTALTVLGAFLLHGTATRTTSYYVMRVPWSLIQQLIGLTMAVTAVRFVGSRNPSNEAC